MITTRQKIERLVEGGMTVSEIARLSEVPQPTIWRIANGTHQNPKENTALAVARIYDERLGDRKGVA